ncbi:MAG: hypothetical protein EPN94_12095 [Nitrospirae bacterium]|nr:MAG: hypothetical protein EPN94_12095 [Nitrospirota bacterium]
MKINVKIIPIEKMPFTTQGYWFEDKDTINFLISEMSDWRYTVAILFHEIAEYFTCKNKGITTRTCDKFDELYESLYKKGEISRLKEPGDDRRCPYFKGHQLGNKFERIMIKELGASWKNYLRDCAEIIERLK